jgi:gliding motility-associated-like protein
MIPLTPIKYVIFIFILLCSKLIIAQTPLTAIDDNFTTNTNTTLNTYSPGILSNDTGDTVFKVTSFSINNKSYLAEQTASFNEGTITIKTDGSFTFIPTNNYCGNIPLIGYTISDGSSNDTANIKITIINLFSPDAKDNYYTTETNSTLNSSTLSILDNDSDSDGNYLEVIDFSINNIKYLAGQTATFIEGTITIQANGTFIYIPTKNYSGNIPTIKYTISDCSFTDIANLNITVVSLFPPEAKDDYDTAEINSTLNVSAPGLLVNDTDIDNNPLKVVSFLINQINYSIGETASFKEGNITLNTNGSFIFIPAKDYTGNVPVINYTISDNTFTNSANLYLTVEPIENLIKPLQLFSCNQGYTEDGVYKIRYSLKIKNTSTARDYHASSLIKKINLTNNLDAIFGVGCVTSIENVEISTNSVKDYINDPYPKEFNNDAVNPDFLTAKSNTIFNSNAIENFTLYPRQTINIDYCVIVNPFCNGRPKPTPSGSGINFQNIVNISSNKGNGKLTLLLTDFHTTEAIVSAGLFIPNSKPKEDSFGRFTYINTVIITNEGNAIAKNINYNMGLGSFFNNKINFEKLEVTQVSGPKVNINQSYNGDTNTKLLTSNNSLSEGKTIILEVLQTTAPSSSLEKNYFIQLEPSQTQGSIDGLDETTAINKRNLSFVIWSDNLGDHLDKYYIANSATEQVSSNQQCTCNPSSSMSFSYSSKSSVSKNIIEIIEAPNGVLEHQKITFRIKATNTSEIVQLKNLKILDNLNSICNGNIVSISKPFIENSSGTEQPILNDNFNGNTNTNLFIENSGLLMPNEHVTVQFSVIFNADCIGISNSIFLASDPLKEVKSSSENVNISTSIDTDNDGITNLNDIDDDNDTILDKDESNGLNPLDDDDTDLIPNYRDLDFGIDANNDGIIDVFDFDNDGVPNHFDLDSDNDGILDIVEIDNKTLDTNNNGKTNNNVGINGLDNTVENNDTFLASIKYNIPNTDGDNVNNPNFLDIDSDGDGIVDIIEAQPTSNYNAPNKIVNIYGIDTAYPNGITPIDTDKDTIFDYIDINSDNDIRNDNIEGWDINNDGIAETIAKNLDLDQDGLDDSFDKNNNNKNPTNNNTPEDFPNIDNKDTAEKDWREIIAIVVLIDNTSNTEGSNLAYTLKLVTKNDNSILVKSASAINIDFSTVNGANTTTIYNEATAPFDYNKTSSKSLNIPAFTNTTTFSITTLDDTIYELNELFTLNGKITTNNTINTQISAIGTILDNDTAPAITMNNSKEKEGIDLINTITISHPSSTPIEIDIKTIDKIAKSSEDYTAIFKSLVIEGTIDPNNANTETSFNISTKIDNLNELNEEFLDIIGSVTSKNVGIQDLTKTGTIIDIDPNPTVTIDNVTVKEGKNLIFNIILLNDNDEPMLNYLPINIGLQTVNETATAIQDYQFHLIDTSIPANTSSITKSILTIDDNLNEDSETMQLQVTLNPLEVSNISSYIFGTGTIEDNDFPNLFSPNSDGKSDIFKISGLESFPNFKLVVINRWGGEVYNYNNNGNTNPIWWNGNHNGIPVIEGVYYYTLDFNDGITPPKTNFIQLIR